jgi:hypothetical protein
LTDLSHSVELFQVTRLGLFLDEDLDPIGSPDRKELPDAMADLICLRLAAGRMGAALRVEEV